MNPTDELVALLARQYQMATPGPWRLELFDAGSGPVPRVVGPDGDVVIEPAPPGDPEKLRDAVYDLGWAVAAHSAMPVLLDAVARLNRELAEAVAALNSALRTIHGDEEYERRFAEGVAAVIRERRRDSEGTR